MLTQVPFSDAQEAIFRRGDPRCSIAIETRVKKILLDEHEQFQLGTKGTVTGSVYWEENGVALEGYLVQYDGFPYEIFTRGGRVEELKSTELIRSHITFEPAIDLHRTYLQEDKKGFPLKPVGLWYGIDGEWQKYCEGHDMTDRLAGNEFRFEIDESRIVRISSWREMKAFCDKYQPWDEKAKSEPYAIPYALDWERLTLDYAGIEFVNYHYMRRFVPGRMVLHPQVWIWFLAWSINGGCLWDLGAIKKVEKIQKA